MENRHTSDTGGQKETKEQRFDLVPARPLWELATLYGRGAAKYDERNWELGFPWSMAYASMMRHAWLFWQGENYDKEMQVPHTTCVAFHAFALTEFLLDEGGYVGSRSKFDDRPRQLTLPRGVVRPATPPPSLREEFPCTCGAGHGTGKEHMQECVYKLNLDKWLRLRHGG